MRNDTHRRPGRPDTWAVVVCGLLLGSTSAVAQPTPQHDAPQDALPVFYQEASWSPDGETLLLSVYRGQGYDIYRIGAGGGRATRLTRGAGSHYWTAWAPSGERFAYRSKHDDRGDIRVMQADGSGDAALTDDAFDDSGPNWSPDGRSIAYTSKRGDHWTLQIMDADGGNVRQIGDPSVDEWNPRFSPDGTRIVFYATENDVDHVYVMKIDGSARTQLARGIFPAWSPDGKSIAYSDAGDIYLIRPEGGNPSHLVTDGFCARWSPDGSKIAFIRGRWPRSEVYLVESNGSDFQRLTGPGSIE